MADAPPPLPDPVPAPARGGDFVWAALVAGGLTGWFNVNFILAHFYRNGPYLFDSGYLATLVYRTTPSLPNPPSFGGGSWLATHITPILYLLSLPSNGLYLPLPAYYALTQGLIYGLLAFAGAWAARPLLENVRGGAALAGLIGLGLGFSGLTLAGVAFPHFEFLFGGLAILFLAQLLREKGRGAPALFVLALLVREDAGLHLFGVLFLLGGLTWIIPEWRWRRRQLGAFMGVALGYSIVVIILQKRYFPGDDALRRIYLGDPLFHQVTRALLRQRLESYLDFGKYLWAPLLILVVAAFWRRSLVLLCWLAAVLPWMVFNFLADSKSAGALFGYYAFPLAVTFIWPALTYAADPRRMTPGRTVILQVVLLGVSLAAFACEQSSAFNAVMAGGFSTEGFKTEEYNRSRDFVRTLKRQKGLQVFDISVAALFPKDVTRADWAAGVAEQRPDLVMGYAGGPISGIILSYALEQGPWHQYALSGLPLYVMSKEALPTELLAAAGVADRGMSLLPPNFGLIIADGAGAAAQPDGGIRDEARYDHMQNIVYGPYVPLPPGKYVITFALEVAAVKNTDIIECDVATADGQKILAKAAPAARTGAQEVRLRFDSTDLADRFEFRVSKQGGAQVLIKSYTLTRAEALPAGSGRSQGTGGAN